MRPLYLRRFRLFARCLHRVRRWIAGAHAGFAAAQGTTKNGTLVVPIKTGTGEDAGTATFKESKDGKELTITVKLKGLPPASMRCTSTRTRCATRRTSRARAGTSTRTASSTAP